MTATELCDYHRQKLRGALAMLDRIERLLDGLPNSLLNRACPNEHWLQFSNLQRHEVEVILRHLHAGRWTKAVCHSDPARIDYEALIDGVKVVLYQAEPPTSCRIETQEIEVPAHTEIVRKLICQ